MNGNGLNFMSRANITEDTTNDEIGAFIGRGRGIDGAAVAGIWDAGELIRDPLHRGGEGRGGADPLLPVGLRTPPGGEFPCA